MRADDIIKPALIIGPLHMRKIEHQHEQHAEQRAQADEGSGDQRQTEKHLSPFDDEANNGGSCRRGEDRQYVVECLGMGEKRHGTEMRFHYLIKTRMQKNPPDRNPEENNQPAFYFCICHAVYSPLTLFLNALRWVFC